MYVSFFPEVISEFIIFLENSKKWEKLPFKQRNTVKEFYQ